MCIWTVWINTCRAPTPHGAFGIGSGAIVVVIIIITIRIVIHVVVGWLLWRKDDLCCGEGVMWGGVNIAVDEVAVHSACLRCADMGV